MKGQLKRIREKHRVPAFYLRDVSFTDAKGKTHYGRILSGDDKDRLAVKCGSERLSVLAVDPSLSYYPPRYRGPNEWD